MVEDLFEFFFLYDYILCLVTKKGFPRYNHLIGKRVQDRAQLLN